MNAHTCQYTDKHNQQCTEQDVGTGLCFWHEPSIDKTGMELSERLEHFAKKGGVLRGVKLKYANLKNVNLIHQGHTIGYDMSDADLYRANMDGAHLFSINLAGASLMKANLKDANLRCANLHNCNLLGTKLQGSKLDNIEIGEHVHQEGIAAELDKDDNRQSAADYYEQSEEIYRNLRKAAEAEGLMVLAGQCCHKELTMRRKQFDKFSRQRLSSKLVDIFCGYGERPANIILFSLALIFVCAVLYFLVGIQANEGFIQFSTNKSFSRNLSDFFASIYFSVVTFTTLGYGDINPVGYSRLIASIEAFVGSFALALYVVVFVKKTTR